MRSVDENTHIILAEDDEDEVFVFKLAIKELPFAVLFTHAEDGEKLMTLLEEVLPDIIFLDILMPCKSGKECIKEIRSNRRFDSIPVVMYTSARHTDLIEETFRHGANFYLIKPNSINELVERLKSILSLKWKQYMFYPTKDEFVIS